MDKFLIKQPMISDDESVFETKVLQKRRQM